MLSMEDMQMEATKKVSFYYLKLKTGKFRVMRRIEQPATIYEVVGEVSDEDTAKEHVERLNRIDEKLRKDK
jgi:hypothetical protein